MEKVIIRDVEEPEKTEIHTKIENTKEGLKQQNNVCGNKFRAILASVGYLI